jgi:hypothetical protein
MAAPAVGTTELTRPIEKGSIGARSASAMQTRKVGSKTRGILMVRAGIPLWSALFLVAISWQVAATPPGKPVVTPPAISSEQPTNSNAAPTPKSEADVVSQINQWVAHKEAISQMETWWRERSKQPDALASNPAPAAAREAISQMETWWKHRTDLQPAMTTEPQRPHRRRRHYATSKSGCPPSVCWKPDMTHYDQTQQRYQQAEQLYRQTEELYQRQLELQRAQQGR